MSAITDMLEPKGGMNGLKMILGAALIVLAGQLDVLNELLPVLPDHAEILNSLISGIRGIIEVIEWLLKLVGNGFLTVGAVHKIWKFIRAIF